MAITRTKTEEVVTVRADQSQIRVIVNDGDEQATLRLSSEEAKQLRKELKQAIRAAEARGF